MEDFIALDALIRQTAVRAPARLAVIDGDRRLTYAAFDDLVDRVAAALQADGLKPRDVLSICAYNSIEYAATFVGALRAGIAVAPLAPSSTPADFAAMVRDSGAKMLFMDADAAAAMGPAANDSTVKRVALDGSTWGRPFGTWCAADAKPAEVIIDPESVFNIIYSSGTTGTPKGIVHSHAMRWRQYSQWEALTHRPEGVTVLSTAPWC
jgi:long-chain acyl-CoA synthetase